MLSTNDIIERILNCDYFYPQISGGIPIRAHVVPTKSKLLFVLGENCSGKSFFGRVLRATCKSAYKDLLEVSLENRVKENVFKPEKIKEEPQKKETTFTTTGNSRPLWKDEYPKNNGHTQYGANQQGYDYSGYGPYNTTSNFYKKEDFNVAYGVESQSSTSVNTIKSILDTIAEAKKRNFEHIIYIDNPELGLSDNSIASLAGVIGNYLDLANKNTISVIISTHSKIFVKSLIGYDPYYVYLGATRESPKSLNEWLEQPIIPTDLSKLLEENKSKLNVLSGITNKLTTSSTSYYGSSTSYYGKK
jgi:hypothetical protein